VSGFDRRPVGFRAPERLRARPVRVGGAVAEVARGHLLEPDPLRVRVDESAQEHRVDQPQLARAARDDADVDAELADRDGEVVGESVVNEQRVRVAAQKGLYEPAGALVARVDDERGQTVADTPEADGEARCVRILARRLEIDRERRRALERARYELAKAVSLLELFRRHELDAELRAIADGERLYVLLEERDGLADDGQIRHFGRFGDSKCRTVGRSSARSEVPGENSSSAS
jgi:hypothetical protein